MPNTFVLMYLMYRGSFCRCITLICYACNSDFVEVWLLPMNCEGESMTQVKGGSNWPIRKRPRYNRIMLDVVFNH